MKTRERHSSGASRALGAWMMLLACFALAQTAAGQGTLDRLRETYLKEVERIRSSYGSRETELMRQYEAAVTAIEKRLQAAGDLDQLLLVKKERERFVATPSLAAGDIVSGSSELSDLQNRCLSALDSIRVGRSRDLLAMAASYSRSLESLQGQLTRAGNLDEALAVKGERAAVESRPEVTSAEFVMAEAEARAPEPPPPVAPPKRPAASTLPEKVFSGSDRTRLSRRYDDLLDALLAGDWRTGLTYVDPDYVEKHGTDRTARALINAFPFLQRANKRDMTVESGDVDIDKDGSTAKVVPKAKARRGGDWHDLRPTYWKLAAGDWFIKLGGEFPAGDNGPEGGER